MSSCRSVGGLQVLRNCRREDRFYGATAGRITDITGRQQHQQQERFFSSGASDATTNNNRNIEKGNWRDWLPPAEYCNPWDEGIAPATTGSLGDDGTASGRRRSGSAVLSFVEQLRAQEQQPSASNNSSNSLLVIQVRHLIQLLQELRSAGHPLTHDRATTERCNHVLKQLLERERETHQNQKKQRRHDRQGQQQEQHPEKRQHDGSGDDNSGADSLSEDRHREHGSTLLAAAAALLEAMQLFDEIGYDNSQPDVDGDDPVSGGNKRKRVVLPFELPKPTRETYQLVLQLYAEARQQQEQDQKRRGSQQPPGPDRALELVKSMRRRSAELGDIEWKPHAFHYNCVLKAWKNYGGDYETKAVSAAKVFLDADTDRDSSSFVIMMQLCAHEPQDEHSRLLGAHLAIKIWQDLIEETEGGDGGSGSGGEDGAVPKLVSHVYAFFLQAIRALPKDNPLREMYFGACMDRAVRLGKVNAVIWNEFLVHHGTKELFERFVGKYRHRIADMSATEASHVLVEVAPPSWSEHAEHPHVPSKQK